MAGHGLRDYRFAGSPAANDPSRAHHSLFFSCCVTGYDCNSSTWHASCPILWDVPFVKEPIKSFNYKVRLSMIVVCNWQGLFPPDVFHANHWKMLWSFQCWCWHYCWVVESGLWESWWKNGFPIWTTWYLPSKLFPSSMMYIPFLFLLHPCIIEQLVLFYTNYLESLLLLQPSLLPSKLTAVLFFQSLFTAHPLSEPPPNPQ